MLTNIAGTGTLPVLNFFTNGLAAGANMSITFNRGIFTLTSTGGGGGGGGPTNAGGVITGFVTNATFSTQGSNTILDLIIANAVNPSNGISSSTASNIAASAALTSSNLIVSQPQFKLSTTNMLGVFNNGLTGQVIVANNTATITVGNVSNYAATIGAQIQATNTSAAFTNQVNNIMAAAGVITNGGSATFSSVIATGGNMVVTNESRPVQFTNAANKYSGTFTGTADVSSATGTLPLTSLPSGVVTSTGSTNSISAIVTNYSGSITISGCPSNVCITVSIQQSLLEQIRPLLAYWLTNATTGAKLEFVGSELPNLSYKCLLSTNAITGSADTGDFDNALYPYDGTPLALGPWKTATPYASPIPSGTVVAGMTSTYSQTNLTTTPRTTYQGIMFIGDSITYGSGLTLPAKAQLLSFVRK